MTELTEKPTDSAAPTIYCTCCGRAMRVSPEHARMTVACPNCDERIEAWRVIDPSAGESPPPPPAAPPPVRPRYDERHQYAPSRRAAGTYSERNRWIAGALGILLGSFGVHRFYLGFVGIGILQAALTVGSFFVLSWVVAIWGFVEGVLCFCGGMRDVDGLPLQG